MSKILKNVTGSNITVNDVGFVTINAHSQYTIPVVDYLLWASSSNVVSFIGAASLVVNDGSFDLSISDGVDLIKGLFPTSLQLEANGTVKNIYAATLVAGTQSGTILNYTVPNGKSALILSIEVSGENIATYDVLLNSSSFAKKRTYFSGPLNEVIHIGSTAVDAYPLVSGDNIEVNVTNFRPSSANFEARFQYIEI